MLPRRAGGTSASSRCQPIVDRHAWVLEDDKLGHTMQSVALAEGLGWPYERKALRFNPLNRLSNRILGASGISLDRRRSTPLSPPWPDLVIATGRRTAPIALWIRRQSGGSVRLVQIGRKGADRPDDFDLSVTCAHFTKPPHPRRVETFVPLTALDDRGLRAARERWGGLFGAAPHPHVAVIVGGSSALHQLDAVTAERLGRDVTDCVRAAGGSAFVVTSPRTGPTAGAALRSSLGRSIRFYEWRSGDSGNPYLGCLALADVLIVTGDSESMLAEALATDSPVLIYPLPEQREGPRHELRAWVARGARENPGSSWRQIVCERLVDLGLVQPSRDIGALHRRLIEAGHARLFGAPLDFAPRAPVRELDTVVGRVRGMFDKRVLDPAS